MRQPQWWQSGCRRLQARRECLRWENTPRCSSLPFVICIREGVLTPGRPKIARQPELRPTQQPAAAGAPRAGTRAAAEADRLIAQALRPDSRGRPAALLALRDGQLAGFIAAAPAWLAPLEWRLLQSSFFYVDPAHRGGRVGLSLFEGMSRLAASHGFEGVYLGTSGEIQTPRTCRLLALRGYRHQGDVLALRLQTSAGA